MRESMTRNLELSKLQQRGNNVGSRTTWIPLYYHHKDIRSVSKYTIKITQQPVYTVKRRESVDRRTRSWNVIYIHNNILLITLHHISKVYTFRVKKRRKIHHDAFRISFARESIAIGQTVTKTLGGIKRMQRILLAEQWVFERRGGRSP